MTVWKSASSFAAAMAALTACVALVSCTALDTSRPSDYVGPADRPPEVAKAPAGEGQAAPQPPEKPVQPAGPLAVTVSQAIIMALENNRSLVVERLNPKIRRTAEEQQRAAFDPDLTAQFSFQRAKSRLPGASVSRSQGFTVQAGIEDLLPAGTLIGLAGGTAFSQLAGDENLKYTSHLSLSVDQPLLRGAGVDVNLVALRQARMDTLSSQYELRGFAETLVAQMEETYWNYALAQKQMDILAQSLALSEQQLAETRERIRVGTIAETEAVAVEAEVALRRQDLINGRIVLEKTRLLFLRLLNPPGGDPFNVEIVLVDAPSVPPFEPDPLSSHIAAAMLLRPDLNQARLQANRGDLDVVKTRNGLLPQLDLFVTLGGTHYADSFGGSVSSPDGRGYALTAGLAGEYPLFNRAQRAAHTRAVLSRRQSLEAMDNLAQLVEVDVRSAYVSITLAKEQVAATAASRKLQEEKLRTETEKFRVGKTTSFTVAQAQRDLVASQIAEVQAVAGYLNAFVELYRLDGSLLVRSGISCPGAEPVKMPSGTPENAPAAPGK